MRKNIAERQGKCQNIEIPYCFNPFTMPATTSSAAYRTTCSNNNTQLLTPQNYDLLPSNKVNFNYYEEQNADYPRTLDLFPAKEDKQDGISERKSMFCVNASMMDTHEINSSSNQFFEFLPLRN